MRRGKADRCFGWCNALALRVTVSPSCVRRRLRLTAMSRRRVWAPLAGDRRHLLHAAGGPTHRADWPSIDCRCRQHAASDTRRSCSYPALAYAHTLLRSSLSFFAICCLLAAAATRRSIFVGVESMPAADLKATGEQSHFRRLPSVNVNAIADTR